MAQLNEQLVPPALAAWPALQHVLKTKVPVEMSWLGHKAVYGWSAAGGFVVALTRDQVFALTQQLLLQVGLPVCFLFV